MGLAIFSHLEYHARGGAKQDVLEMRTLSKEIVPGLKWSLWLGLHGLVFFDDPSPSSSLLAKASAKSGSKCKVHGLRFDIIEPIQKAPERPCDLFQHQARSGSTC